MSAHKAVLLLALAAAAAAAPYGGNIPRCSTECPLAAAKLSYIPGKTYSYTFSGNSKVHLKGIEGGLVENKWTTQVMMTVLSPCDWAISYKDTKMDGKSVPHAEAFEKYPFVMAMTDGRVQRICTHPEDDTWSINLKKGLASHMQISLPSLSTTNSGLNLTETDVLGTCPTYYEVMASGPKVMVKKEKNHRLCQDHYPTPDETLLPYLMGPLPMQESRSVCIQEIENGIISKVVCQDKKTVRPSIGVYKHVEAEQESLLMLTSSDVSTPDTISRITQGSQLVVPRSLRYDYETPKKELSLVPQLEQILRHICENTKEGVEAHSAIWADKAVHLMRRIPEQGLKEVYANVRNKHLCPDHHKMESIFMDALASVHEPETVELMVKEMLEERTNTMRTTLYSVALYLVKRPNEKSIQVLEPLFKSEKPKFLMAKLAASSMVNTYCRHNPNCHEESSVRMLQQAIKQKIEQDLSSSSTEQSEQQVLSAFKTLGNMGVMSPDTADAVIRYIKNENKKVNIRVAAAQAFRRVKSERPVTQQLVQYALKPDKNTEVRIASYLAAIPNVDYETLQEIVAKISQEKNTQVRGFVLSHLLNLQQSDAPEKEGLRYNLTNILIPQDFRADLRKYSRNLDLSYFSPSLGVGAELESNLIYAPGSFIPRSLNLNLTAALDGTGVPINIGEIGGRLEGLEPIIAKLLGPASYFKTSTYTKLFRDLVSFLQKEWKIIQQEVENSIRERRSIDYSTIRNIFSKLYGTHSETIHADVFARFLGQEVNYATMSKQFQEIDIGRLVHELINYIKNALHQMNNIDTAQAAQFGVEYSFPTIHGVPLKLSMDTMAVFGLKVESNLRASDKMIKILPSLSTQTHAFIGYDTFTFKSGLKMNTTVSTSNGVGVKVSGQTEQELHVEVDIPEKMEIIRVQSETYLMKKYLDQPDIKIRPSSIQDIRMRGKSCFTSLESVLGLKMCYDIDVPDVFRANSLPLGSPAIVHLSLNKTESTIKGYKAVITHNSVEQGKNYNTKLSVLGSSSPKETKLDISLKEESESYDIDLKLQSSTAFGEANVRLVNRSDRKSVQTEIFLNNGPEFSKAIRFDFEISPSERGKKYEMNVFSNPSGRISPQNKIFTSQLVQNKIDSLITVDTSAQTLGILQQCIPFHLEVAGDLKVHSGIPLPSRLRKFELQSVMFEWKVVSYIRMTRESDNKVRYPSALQVFHQGKEVIDIQSSLSISGTPGVDFDQQLITNAKIGQSEYKLVQVGEYKETKKGFKLELSPKTDQMKMIQISVEKDSNTFKSIFYVGLPQYLFPIKLTVKAEQQGEMAYNTEVVIKVKQQMLLQLQGPITYVNSESQTKLGINIKMNNLYQFDSLLEFVEDKQHVHLEIKKQNEVLVSLEGTLKTPSQSTSLETKFILPMLIDGATEVKITNDVIHVVTNTLLLPRSSSARRIKAFMDIDWRSKMGHMMMLWNADKDQSQKINVDAVVQPDNQSPAKADIKIKTMIKEEVYLANLAVVVPYVMQQYRERNSIEMEVETPQGKKWKFNVGIQDKEPNVASADVLFQSVHGNTYQLKYDATWEYLNWPLTFKGDSKITYMSPDKKESTFVMQATHDNSPQRRIIHMLVEASTPSLQTPLRIMFSTQNQDYSYVTKLVSKKTLYSWQLQTLSEGGVKQLDVVIDLTAIRDLLKTVTNIVTLRSTSVVSVNSSHESSSNHPYNVIYTRRSHHTHNIKLESPSRSVEAETTFSPTKASIKVYPDHYESEAKYELTGEYLGTSWGGGSTYKGRISHPLLSRDMEAVVEYMSTGSSQKGSFELDILPDPSDKITGTLTSYLRANNTIVVEADLSTRVLKVKPNVTMEVSWAPHTAAFNFTFQETPTSPVSLKVYGKYDRISMKQAVVTFLLENEGRPTIDVSGTIEPRTESHCDGYELKANTHTSLIGDFIVNSTVCKPNYLEVVLNKPHTTNVYKTVVGLQLPYKSEVSISKTDLLQIKKDYITIIGIELANPRWLKIDYDHKHEQLMEIQNFVLSEWYKVYDAFLSWTDQVYNEVKNQASQANIPFPAPQIRDLLKEIENDLNKIYTDVIYNDISYEIEMIKNILKQPSITFIRNFMYQTMKQMYDIQRQYTTYTMHEIDEMLNYLRPITDELTQDMREMLRWVESAEEPELIRRLLEDIRRTSLYRVFETNVLEPIKEAYPHQYQVTLEVIAKIISTLRHDAYMLEQKIWNSPTLHSFITKITNLKERKTLQQSLEWLQSQVIETMLFVSPEPGQTRFGVRIPLPRPIYSLAQIVNMTLEPTTSLTEKVLLSTERITPIPVNKILESYYSWMPSTNFTNLMPPFNSSALVVGDKEIVTFDGVLLRIPLSPCKVLLASIPEVVSVYMSHPQPSQIPEIAFQTQSTKVIIKPNMEVQVNGRPMSGRRQTVGDVVIEADEQYVTLVSPMMGVQQFKDERVLMVNVSGWAFNHTKGLLGLYDGEKSNDMMLSSGTNSSSLQQLVKSWQENPSCNTPDINPINPSKVPMKERVLCDIGFFMMRPCLPVVNPKPFMTRCWTDPQPFKALHSYKSFCRKHGVLIPISIF